jgi:glutamyl-tRNA synthetase
VEDTDIARSTKEFEQNMIDAFTWLGLTWDEFYRQSERTDIYKSYLRKMIDAGFAYESQEEVKEEGQRASVIRFKNPNRVVTFQDLIRGEISVDTTDLGDFVIAKSFDEPLYHLAVVVDDHEMNISHIIRGDDHVSNTPRQILIQEAIGATKPIYAHIPLILSKERKKLSKRDGATALTDYRDKGYIKDAMVNFLAFMGWHPEGDDEVLSIDELIKQFDISRVQKGGAIFDTEKLDWFNREYIKKLSDKEFARIVNEYSTVQISNPAILELIRERVVVFSDIATLVAPTGELGHLLFDITIEDTSKLIWKDSTPEQTKEFLSHVIATIGAMDESDFTPDKLKEALWDYASEKGRGAVLWPTRYALSGLDRSPDPFALMSILGKEKSLIRLGNAVSRL